MKTKSRILITLILSFLMATSCASKPVTDPYTSLEDVYAIYVKNLSSSGQTPATYEEWLELIKGEKGDAGEDGKDGLDGSKILVGTTDPAADYGSDGDSYINTETWDFFIKVNGYWIKKGNIKGEAGAPGEPGNSGKPGNDGKSAYEIYLEEHPEYHGTEEQWLDDLVNGRLGDQVAHTVTFRSDDVLYDTQIITHGDFATKPEDPSKEGYNFLYWEDENFDKWLFDKYTITKDLTLYAVWEDLTPELALDITPSSLSLNVGESGQINASVTPSTASIGYYSNDSSIASVTSSGLVTAHNEGTTTITVTAIFGTQVAEGTVTVDVYDLDEKVDIATYSKPGHLYVHYLRTSDRDYDRWGFWTWQNFPSDLEGSLWGANDYYVGDTSLRPMSYGYMARAQLGLSKEGTYCDENGQIIDVDLTADVKGGKTGSSAPLVDWDSLDKCAMGFLIVDQSSSTATNWVSDGGAETFIKKLGTKMTDGKNSYLHIYCVEDNVSGYTYESGSVLPANPTETDKTGSYRTYSNISNLLNDKYPSGIATSSAFLGDRPGTGYDIFVPSFADSDGDGYGDINGVYNKLEYIKDLGVSAIHLSNLCSAEDYDGIAVKDHFSIDPKLGDTNDLNTLITAAHNYGIKVVLSLNFFLMSKESELFQKSEWAESEVVDGKTVEYRNMFHWRFKGDKTKLWDGKSVSYGYSPNYLSVAVQENPNYEQYKSSDYYYLQYNGYPRLNFSCQETRDYVKKVCNYWLSLGADGLFMVDYKNVYTTNTLDDYNISSHTINYDVFTSTKWNPELEKEQLVENDFSIDRDALIRCWKEIVGDVKTSYPNSFIMGDYFDGWDERMSPQYESFDSMNDYPTYYKLYEQSLSDLGGAISNSLTYYKTYRANFINGAFTSTKDVTRLLNHTIGNADTTVDSSNRSDCLKKARYMAALAILTPGLSWIYYGDELGMSSNTGDSSVNDHGMYHSRFYRQPMRWGDTLGKGMVPNYSVAGFDMEWDNYNSSLALPSAQASDSTSLYNLYKAAIAVKNSPYYPTYGYINNYSILNGNYNVIRLDITDGTRRVLVFINNTYSPVDIPAIDRGTILGGSVGFGINTIPEYGFVVVRKS